MTKSRGNTSETVPRLIRFRDAPSYLGMNKNLFNEQVRPYLIELPIGSHGIAFDRLDLDAWVDHYKACSGRPAERRTLWDEEACPAWSNVARSGISTKLLTDDGFAKALEQEVLRRPKSS